MAIATNIAATNVKIPKTFFFVIPAHGRVIDGIAV